MHVSSHTVKIIAAALIAVTMIGTSLWLTQVKPRLVSALSTDELLRAYVEQDTDDDGLPDWKEEAYGTDPSNPFSVKAGLTDLEALQEGHIAPAFTPEEVKEPYVPFIPGKEVTPNTLTARFSDQFAEAYFAQGGTMSESEQQALINTLLATFSEEASRRVASSYTSISLRTDPSISFEVYIESLGQIFTSHPLNAEEADLLSLAQARINESDGTVVQNLKTLGATYGAIRDSLLALPVHKDAVAEHVALLRSFDSLSKMTAIVEEYDVDPIASLGSLSVFEENSLAITEAIRLLVTEILSSGEPEPDTAAAMFTRIIRAAEQP